VMRVLLGITGGIAAYKATGIIRGFTEAGHSVKVIPTANALRFIGATTLEALSHNTVDSDLYSDVESVKHVALGQEADLVVVAPASAAFLARYAAGLADDLLLNALLVTKAPVLVAPAMHTEMWQNPATAANVATLRARGVTVLEPDSGRLTGSDTGPGRLPEAEAIVALGVSLAALPKPGILTGKHVLVTAGGTQEAIDPVRFIGNRSSGKQGVAIAFAASAAGARVTLIGANLEVSTSGIANVISVNTAAELQEQVDLLLATIDVLIMAAAVADYRVENPLTQKIKRSEAGEQLELRLIANPDILAHSVLRIRKENLKTLVVGFAAETAGNMDRLATLASVKLEAKGCQMIVANDVSQGQVFGSDHNSVYLLSQTGESSHAQGSKQQVASHVVNFIAGQMSAAADILDQ
jgi:phosphopantothenoylcysteine decarboxylase/phosphopantothenate--cysteine ligase